MKSNSSYLEERYIYCLYIIFDSLFFITITRDLLNSFFSFNSKSFLISFTFYFIWTLNNYILGSYIANKSKVFNIFFKLFFNYNFSLIIYLPIIIIAMINYPTINKIPIFIAICKLNYLSFLMHFVILIIFGKSNKKPKWLFLGKEEVLKKIKKECQKCNFNIEISLYKKYRQKVDGIIVDDSLKNTEKIGKLKNTILLSDWLGLHLNKYPIDLIPDLFLIGDDFNFNKLTLQLRIKNVCERLIALILLITSIPITIVAGLLIYLDDGLPIFYSQNRNGEFNKVFKINKLRTMKLNAEKDGAVWSKKNDNRITRIGNLIRRIRIDELPQLVSVIKGEMSLIGPRPERPEIDALLSKKIKNYNIRYNLKPGLSGWAQVNYPYGASIEDAKEKFSYDIYYVRNYSNLLDILILIKTLKIVFNAKGSVPKS